MRYEAEQLQKSLAKLTMGQRDRGELRRHSLTAVSSFADAERSTKRKKSMATRDEPGRIEPAQIITAHSERHVEPIR